MNYRLMLGLWLLLASCVVQAAEPARYRFAFTLPQAAAVTSAGVYDVRDHLVQTLWTMQPRAAGAHTAAWDGRDADGGPAPAGTYTCKVVVNRSTYTQRGIIGNTGTPSNTFGHVPINFEAVATDRDGFIYTVHDWDEPHHDVIRWHPTTGAVASHAGHPVSDLMKAVAVDDDFAYVSIYSNLNDRAKSKFYLARLRIDKTPGAAGWPVVPFTTAGKFLMVYANGAPFPEGVSEADRALMRVPLLALAVHGRTLYVTDALAGLVRMYDKVTGEATGTIAVPLPQAVAIAPDGRVWVGHGRRQVSVFTADGKPIATPIVELSDVNALAFGADGSLYVADQGAGQVTIYTIAGATATVRRTLGQKAVPGDRAPDRFFHLHGLAVDGHGNIITAQNEFFFNGGRLAKFAADGKALWEQLGLEFQSIGTYGASDPETFISVMCHSYRLNRATGSAAYLGQSYTGTGYHAGPTGTPRICRIGAHDFYYYPCGDGVQIYRLDPNPAGGSPLLVFVSILGRAQPLPTGKKAEAVWKPENFYLWSWHDVKGDHTIHPEDVTIWSKPEDKRPLWQYGPLTVDADKNIWIPSYDRGGNTPEKNSVWMVPLAGLDPRGNPIYEWKNVVRVIPTGSLRWETGVKMVQHDAEGYTYLYGASRRTDAPQNGGVWMGGNSLACFDGAERRWQIILPQICVGLDVIPGNQGGCIIGGDPFRGGLHHYTRDGLLVGTVGPDPKLMGEKPHNPSGLLDFFGAVVVKRNPRDGLLDVFVEDDYNLRIAWYRIDDRAIDTLTGAMELVPSEL
jgi:sugar lactone lactonase YvrE